MKFQYTLIFLVALVLVIPSSYGLHCYNEECEEKDYSCPEVGDPSELTKESCDDYYPDRTPICVKSVHYETTGGSRWEDEDSRRVIAVYRRCAYALGKHISSDCNHRHIHGKFEKKECVYTDNLSNF